jgi:uncharacterized DUF497 family protein
MTNPGEQRVHHGWDGSIGQVARGRLYMRGTNIRIISARRAETPERAEYEAEK